MATSWVKSLHCKSKVLDDVYSPTPKHLSNHLLSSSSCRKSVQSLKDVVETTTNNKKQKKNPTKSHSRTHTPSSTTSSESSRYHSKSTKSNNSDSNPKTRLRPNITTSNPFFPALTELSQEHPSHNVLQMIFNSSWSTVNTFSGQIEMVFKVENRPKTIARFEEYREIVKTRAVCSGSPGNGGKEEYGRCIADGNEVMGFYCVGPTAGGAIYDLGGLCEFTSKNRTICTFSGSGRAHESVGGGGKGRRAMLICRVLAGRVCKKLGVESFSEGRVGFDSVSGDNEELFVFDARAVLPCFLIMYKP
ncbi:Zinc finger, C2H2 protein [Thalictrum thalictroides]|uniref:Zinc finger, C2H2 protein n=1 Tax=Thalictrum thalictroides TaxID=46969 RepID=A0A7J6VYU0_THATH|nr:Zinc finger, C2H2 protein [Thalictrum thalictroides]